jgi:hypothetical protein
MNQRFAVLAEGATPKIYKLPINQTARLINEVPGRKVEVFETLNGAREAALTLVESAKANARPGISILSNGPDSDYEELLKTLSELTEGRVERYYF